MRTWNAGSRGFGGCASKESELQASREEHYDEDDQHDTADTYSTSGTVGVVTTTTAKE